MPCIYLPLKILPLLPPSIRFRWEAALLTILSNPAALADNDDADHAPSEPGNPWRGFVLFCFKLP